VTIYWLRRASRATEKFELVNKKKVKWCGDEGYGI
jgi:hypothetical protein